MPIDTSRVNQKITIPNGELLFPEGVTANSLNIIHEGAYRVEKKINGVTLPLLQIAGKNLTPGVISLFTTGRYPFTLKAVQDCVVSTYQVTPETIKKTIFGKMSIGVMIARTLLREILELTKRLNSIQSLSSKVEQLNDSLSILYFILEPSVFPNVTIDNYAFNPESHFPDETLRLTRENLSIFLENGGKLPDAPTTAFLNDNHEEFLRKSYREEIDFEDKEFLFIRKILSTDPNIQNPIFEADITILTYICEKLSGVYDKLLETLDEVVVSLSTGMETLCGKETSLMEKYYIVLEGLETGLSDLKPEQVIPITESFNDQLGRFLLGYRNIFFKEFPNLSANYTSFKDRSSRINAGLKPQDDILDILNAGSDTPAIKMGFDAEAMKKELTNSASQIMNYVRVQPEQVKEFSSLILKLKTMQNPLDTESDARKIRKNIAKTFWDIYEKAFLKIQTDKNPPKPVSMMLKYGYFDETLLENPQLVYLYTLKEDTTQNRNIPVQYGDEWLQKIYERKVVTSISEMDQTFFDKVKEELKDMNIKKESEIPAHIDTGENRLKFELQEMYQPTVRLTTGNPATHLPILTKYHITISLDKCLVTREKLSQALTEILAVDYTAFNREIVYNDEQRGILKELVQRSIVPDFIVVPSLGSKIMMWQFLGFRRGAGSKESRGRIVVPLFASGDLKTMLLESIGRFRWELCKEILGPDWNNPGIPSITSEYSDYMQFYKKNKDLSIELKEKIAIEFKRFRNDYDKFINDYLIWIKFESEGIQRLNRVVRNIFYKHIPFSKDIRDKVSKLPAFVDMHNRFTNIRNRQYKEYENRYRKYLVGDKLPPVLQENLDFYKV